MGSRLAKNSSDVSKRIQSHSFTNEDGEEYEGSKFGGFRAYMRRKKIKLQNLDAELRSQTVDKPQIFRGVVAQVNGYTQPSLSDLHALIVSHGGGFLQYLDGKTACTHIIASQLTPKKKAEFAKYRIVRPAWVVDSVNAGKLLPWDNYRLVDEGVTQKVLGFENGSIVSQTNNPQQSYRAQADTSWYTSHVKDLAQGLNGSAATYTRSDDLQDKVGQQCNGDQAASLSPPARPPADDSLDDSDEEYASLIRPAFEPPSAQESSSSASKRPSSAELDEQGTLKRHSASLVSESIAPSAAMAKTGDKRQLSAEEHNAILLQDPHIAKSSTANPDFINQYYRESRLHHLSTWKADLKAQLQARAVEKSASQKSKHRSATSTRRYIMHVDFDSFFAAVSLRKNPHLVDKPVAIAHGNGPGSEIASCNYPARKFGVKNGMWMKSALELCPNIQVLPYDFEAYEEASRHFYDSILAIDGVVQSISIDEALIDVSEQCIKIGGSDGKRMSEGVVNREQDKANELARSLRISVKEDTGCDVSVGIGGNILLAKVALRKAKPAGQHQIKPEEILDFIGELNVTDLPGVAYSLGAKLAEMKVKLVKDIRALTKERLMNSLGPKTGERLWDYARGIDKAEVGDQVVRKSVSAEVNWGIRFVTQQQAEDFVQCLCDELHKRLLENGVKGRQMTMKIMRKAADAGMDPPKNLGHGKCDTFNKSVALGVSTNDKVILGKEAISILRSYGFSPGELRGLGVQMQKLEPIKASSVAGSMPTAESSQRRLQFKKTERDATPKGESPRFQQSPAELTASASRTTVPAESIEEIPTPEKKTKPTQTIQGAIVQSGLEEERPLNIIGTQFMLPSQIDPTVLAELPSDIRSKLAPKQRSIADNFSRSESPKPMVRSRSESPYLSDMDYSLPNQSQLDPEILAALPADVKEELLEHYRAIDKPGLSRQNQRLLPQSPRKVRPVSTTNKVQLTPTKKRKTSTLSKTQLKTKGLSFPALKQSNFVSVPKPSDEQANHRSIAGDEISKSFLEELPEDVRQELIVEQRRNRMKQKAGLNLEPSRRRPMIDTAKDDPGKGQQKLQLLGYTAKPTFTSRRLSALPDLRDAMSAWVQEYSGLDEEGPFEEDATALGQYLQKVVLEEGDMSKAASVVEWLAYLVCDWPFHQDVVRDMWLRIVSLVQDMVQSAVAQRGLPPLVFDVS